MKVLLPWLLAVLGFAAAAYYFTANRSAGTQIARLQTDLQELPAVRAENAALRTNVVPPDELARLRKDSADVLRLRNEIRQLREARSTLAQQAQTAQTLAEQAQQQAAQAQAEAAAANQRAMSPPPLTAEQQAAFAARYGLDSTNAVLIGCLSNLRQLDGAKLQWALENGKSGETTPKAEELAPYLPGSVIPRCPGGGRYGIGVVAVAPMCTIPGHELPPQAAGRGR
jgi:hypothetical protein